MNDSTTNLAPKAPKIGGGRVRLYKLTSGEYQVNAVTDEAGKEYVFRWDGA